MNHDKIVENLEMRLRKAFPEDTILTKIDFDLQCREQHGEMDLLWIHNNIYHPVEIKQRNCYLNRQKAVYTQLPRDCEHILEEYPYVDKIIPFYAYSRYNKRGYYVEKI